MPSMCSDINDNANGANSILLQFDDRLRLELMYDGIISVALISPWGYTVVGLGVAVCWTYSSRNSQTLILLAGGAKGVT